MKAKDHQLIVLPQEGEKEVSEHRRKYEWEKVMKNPCLTNVSVGCEAIHFMMFEQQWDIVFVDEIEEEDKSLSIKNELVAWFALVGLRWALRDHRVSMFLLQRLLRGLKNHPKNNFNDWMELFIAACQTIVDTKGEVLASFLPNYALKTNINLDPLRDAAKHLSHLLHYFCLSRSFLKGPSPKGFHDINQIRLLFDRKAEELIGFPKQHGWVFGTVVSPRKEKEPLPDFEFYGGAGEIFNSFALYDTFLDGPHGKYIYAKEILDTHIRMVKKILYREALFLGFHEKTSHGRFSEALPDAELLVKHFSDEEGSFLRLVHVCLCLEDRKKAAEVCQSGVTRFPDSFDLKDLLVGMMSEENDAHGPFRHRKIYFRPSTFRKFLVETVNENWESEPLGECPPLFWIDLPPRIIGDSALEETVLKRGWEEFSKRREGKKVIGVISSPSIIIPLIEWCPGVGPFILTIFRDKEGCEVLLMLDNFPGVSQYVFIIFNFLHLRTIFSYLLPSYHKKSQKNNLI